MTDLVPSQGYGQRAQQEAALEAVPLAKPNIGPPQALMAPSQRPNEPVQTGLPVGPGAGPEVLPTVEGRELSVATLKALYRRFPAPELADAIAREERMF